MITKLVLTVKSPYADDETRTKEISKILEEFLYANWDQTATTVSRNDIAFGKRGDQMLETDKAITLRAYSFWEKVTRLTVDGSRREYEEGQMIDVYVMDNENNDGGRDSRAVAIRKWFDKIFSLYQGTPLKGIYELDYQGAGLSVDPFKGNVTRVKARLFVRYILDIVPE